MEFLLAPETRPFTVAALIVVGLVGVEVIALLIGFSVSEWVDGHASGLHADGHGDASADAHGSFGSLLDWLNTGRVPLLVLIMLALGGFAVTGFVLEAIARALWTPLPALVAVPAALAVTVPFVRAGSRAIARVVPRDETYAVDVADFVGCTAEVTVGPLDQGLPGRVRVRDVHGNWHVERARAAKGQTPMAVGATVLLVDRDGATFLAIPAPADLVER